MTRVIIITEYLSNYRIPFFNKLAISGSIDLTVAHTEKAHLKNVYEFKQLIYNKSKIFNLVFFATKTKLYKEIVNFEVIVCMFNLRFLDMYKILYISNKPVILWGIGLSSDNGFGKKNFIYDFFRKLCAKKAKGLIFYSKIPFEFYLQNGISQNKIFSINNSISWSKTPDYSYKKESFLFIGTLYKRKRVDILINALEELHQNGFKNTELIIVGKGEEMEVLKLLAKEKELEKSIHFKGEISDEGLLQEYYNKSILCLSPGQAGLTVLQSMAAGVVFVTSHNAITGGEISFIENNVTGVLYNGDQTTLFEIMRDSIVNTEKYIEMGKMARVKYEQHYSIDNMVINFQKCLNYVISYI